MREVAERTRVAVLYSYQEAWIGGTYYIENLISALNHLDDADRPQLLVFSTEKDFLTLTARVSYPYLTHWLDKPLGWLSKGLNKLLRAMGLGPLVRRRAEEVEFLFPSDWDPVFRRVKNKIFWIADYQEHFMPEMFSVEEVAGRKAYQRRLIATEKNLVFSSQSAQADFQSLYPENALRQFVLPFAVTLPSVKRPGLAELKAVYDLPDRYFICCNQFWKHKNHGTLFQAIPAVLQQEPNLVFCFTGSQSDRRNPGYFDELNQLIDSLGIRANLRFLGFIPREHQLGLIENALATIQPSRFEGWSTVIEDAKALNVPIVASDLAVHREQLVRYSSSRMFAVSDVTTLEQALLDELATPAPRADIYAYDDDLRAYAGNFLAMLRTIRASEAGR